MKAETLSLLELEKFHEGLDRLFYCHQVAVLNQDREAAVRLLDGYDKLIRTHMREEEETLIPLYEKRCGAVRSGAHTLFSGEHKRIRGFMTRFYRLATLWMTADEPGRETLDLLDQEHRFKNLMHQHGMREQRILLPELDKVTSETEKRDLLGRFTRTPDSLLPPEQV